METFFMSTVLFSLFLGLLFTEAAPQDALITHLPGFNGVFPSKHYSGYVTVDEEVGKNLFYYFVVSERNPIQDPVVLWLNGGPGCSSFGGFVYEHGPFTFKKAQTPGNLPQLQLNPYSWSKVSNIIYLDSPAGVGLSYCENPEGYKTGGDLNTALDAHTFLLKWFEQYPEFLPNQFYLAGESYAGVYVPALASELVKGIDNGLKPVLNFKGYMVGNGVTDKVFDGNARVSFAHGMGLISDNLFEAVTSACNGSFWDPIMDSRCWNLLQKVHENVKNLNIYDILEPCYQNPKAKETENVDAKTPSGFRRLGETDRPLPVRERMFGHAWPNRAPVRDGVVPEPLIPTSVDCTDESVANLWLNDKIVRKALHGRKNLTWWLCIIILDYDRDLLGNMIPYHRNLTTRGYRALIYSGDHDMSVPFTGSEAWTRSLGYKILDEWRPWFVNDDVAGFTQGYDHNLTFLTIMGAGHTVPTYKPKEALAFYSRWLAAEKI